MSNTTIQYFGDGGVSISAKNTNPMLLHISGPFGTFNVKMNDMLSGDETSDKDIVDAVIYGIKYAFSHHTALFFDGGEIKTDAVSTVELCRQDGTSIATITNEGIR